MKLLRRPYAGRVLAGVCAGVAEYLSIDPVMVRVIWAIFCLGGVGVIAYLIAALIIPSQQ